jgi:hypothetical protein
VHHFSLGSRECLQVVSQYSSLLAPLVVDAVLNVHDLDRPDSVDLRDIKVLKKLGGTVGLTLSGWRFLITEVLAVSLLKFWVWLNIPSLRCWAG